MARGLWTLLLAIVLFGAAPHDDVWVVASDIHLNPFDHSGRPSPSRRDGNAVVACLARPGDARGGPRIPAWSSCPGIFWPHHFDLRARERQVPGDSAGLQAMAAVAKSLGSAFPESRFAVALGNNDAPCGDYRTDFETPYSRALSQIWAPLILRGADSTAPAQLARDGYYTLRPFDGVRVAVLDTVVFSQMRQAACRGSAPASAQRQIDWLDATLPAAPPACATSC